MNIHSPRSSIIAQQSLTKRVFEDVDTDKSGFIDLSELANAIMRFDESHSEDFVAKVLRREQVTISGEGMNYGQFETFLVKFLRNQLYDAIDEYVVNRTVFQRLQEGSGGRSRGRTMTIPGPDIKGSEGGEEETLPSPEDNTAERAKRVAEQVREVFCDVLLF